MSEAAGRGVEGLRERLQIAVVGAGEAGDDIQNLAEAVGREVGAGGAVLICGGLGGVMAAACRGAKDAGGVTVGVLPGDRREDANPWVDVAVPTGMGEMRNALVVRTADVVVAVHGEYGTLVEIAYALKAGTPVVGIRTWELATADGPVDDIVVVADPVEAVSTAFRLGEEQRAARGGPP